MLAAVAWLPLPSSDEAVAADVAFTRVDNRVFIAATLVGVGPSQMLLDTGADNLGVSRADPVPWARKEAGDEISGAGEKAAMGVKTPVRSMRTGTTGMRDLPTLAHAIVD